MKIHKTETSEVNTKRNVTCKTQCTLTPVTAKQSLMLLQGEERRL